MLDIIIDTLIDTIKLIPFLLLAFFIIELIEHKLNDKTTTIISKSGKLGVLLGSSLGLIPQCGFSVVATNLYITRIISLGTLISIYLSTSDEMIPILLSEKVGISLIIKILAIKFIFGLIFGYIIDFILRHKKKELRIHELCEDEDCHCEDSILKPAVIHTLKTSLFILISTFIINTIFHYLGEQYLSNILLKDSFLSPFITCLIGLIPNCGSSVILTELYLNNAINFASLCSGLLTCSGIALLILFKSNKNIKENITILSLVYLLGVLSGTIIKLIMYII